ncbi:16886_t:CDS:1, partial [Gigaspora rosea]
MAKYFWVTSYSFETVLTEFGPISKYTLGTISKYTLGCLCLEIYTLKQKPIKPGAK